MEVKQHEPVYINYNKRRRTEREDSGFETGEEVFTNYVTEEEFAMVLDIVMKCEILGHSKGHLDREEMEAIIKSQISPNYESLMEIILANIDKLLRRRMNQPQLTAFIVDIQTMFEKQRDILDVEEGRTIEIII